MNKIYKVSFFILILLFIMISPNFAQDNQTSEMIIGDSYNDVYFNASSVNDGDGSFDNPYNKIMPDRIKNYATIHLANGEYDMVGYKSISSLSIIGESSQNTILNHEGLLFNVSNRLTLNNLTLSGSYIENHGIINATEVIFSQSSGSPSDRYDNKFGGVIDNWGNEYQTPKLYINSCIFRNNNAHYGGAIYLINAEAYISDSVFEKNTALNYGGAIACDGSSILEIKNTNFKFDSSINDAGGALYLKNSTVNIINSNFTSCNATFGGAICDLYSNTNALNILCSNNFAKYDGGALYKMYGELSISDSKFSLNSANNGGAVFVDNSSSLLIESNRFNSNTANYYGGAIYSLLNLNSSIKSNVNSRNKANNYSNLYETNSVNHFIGNGNYSLFKINSTLIQIPEKYSIVDNALVTSVKDQQASGNCWAFAALAALESCILKASNSSYDFSEENLKNLMALYSDYGWNIDSNNGGYDEMAIGYLVSWLGPILEEDNLFDDYSTLSPILNSIMHVQNILFLGRDNFTDNNKIKEAILKYGAVATGLCFYSNYLNGDAYYYVGSDYSNHAVTIVGWDDNYPYYNFKNAPPKNGAWLVKNSWGKNWGNNGYFYVSYYDTRFAQVGDSHASYTFILNDTYKFDKNYQYDIIGMTDYFVTGHNTVWYSNVFNSTEDEILTAFSTYFNTTSNWTAYIYVNDNLCIQQNGTSVAGYFTINLDKNIYLNKGDIFKIVIKLSCDSFASFPISEKIMSNKIFYSKECSFFSYDGEEWYDLYQYSYNAFNHHYNSQVACIKAFTILPSISIKIDDYGCYVNETINITAFLDESINEGTVVFSLNNQNYSVNVTNGIANLEFTFTNIGNNTVYVRYSNNGIFSNVALSSVNVKNTILNSKIQVNNYSFEINEKFNITAKITDENDDLINEGIVTFIKENNTYSVKLINGIAVFETSFNKSGNYTISIVFKNDLYYSSNNISYINVYKKDLNLSFLINDIDFTDDLIVNISCNQNVNLKLEINGDLYDVNIKNPTTLFDVKKNYGAGNYIVKLLFNGDDEYNPLIKYANFTIKRLTLKPLVNVNISINNVSISFNFINNINDTFIVKINDELYNVDVFNGFANLQRNNLKIGEYKMEIYTNNINYEVINDTNVFSIDKIKTQLVSQNISMYYKNGSRLHILLVDELNNSLSNRKINISINGMNYTKFTNINGRTSLGINLNSGKYNVTISFEGGDEYDSCSIQNEVIVNPTIKSNNLTKYFRNSSQYYAVLYDYQGNALSNKVVSMNINGVFYNRTSNNEGRVRLNINLESGEYILTVINPVTGEKSSNLIRVLSKLVDNEDLIKFYRNASQYHVKLLDDAGNPLANETVTFNINGVFYNRVTKENGVARLNINLQTGDYIITAEYKGCRVSNNIKVLSVIKSKDLEMHFQDGSKFEITLLNSVGNPYSNQMVSFNINGVLYNRITNNNGVAKLNIKLQSGKYIITSSYNGLNTANTITIH